MTACYKLEFETKPYGFRIVGDDHNQNAIVKAILNPLLAKSLYVGSWITQINDIVVETWDFSAIISVLRDAELPVSIKFRQCLILSGTDEQLMSHEFTPNLSIEVSDTGKEPSQQKQGKPFVAYNLFISDTTHKTIPLKWQLWKRYNQFETLHKQLVRLVPDLAARLPPKQHFGRFKPGFIQQRRVQLQRYIDEIKHHPGIVNSNEFRNFLMPTSSRACTVESSSNKKQSGFTYANPSEMKPILLEIRDRLETLCDGIEMNCMERENILSSVRYLLSIVGETCTRTKDPMDATTVSRNFTTGLPNNNAFIKQCDDIFYAKYQNECDEEDEEEAENLLEWALLLIDIDDFSRITQELRDDDHLIGDNLLRAVAQTIYSCVTSKHQKVFHLDADTFAFLTPIDATDDIQRLAGSLLTRIRAASIPIDMNCSAVIPIQTETKKKKKQASHIEYLNKQRGQVNVFLTVSIGISILQSQQLLCAKLDKSASDIDSALILDASPADWIQRADLSLQRAKKGTKNCVGALLEHEDRGAQDFRNDISSSWFSAAANGEHARILEMVKTGYAVDTLQISYDSDTKLTALMTAAIYDHSEVARTLLRYAADINLQDEYGRTCLIHSAQNGSIKTAKVLLECGAAHIDLNRADKTLRTALMYAARQAHHKMVRLLLNRHETDVNKQDAQGCTALMYAIQSESLKCANLILDHHSGDLTLQDEAGQTCLMCASKKKGQNYHNLCARMIQNGAQINCQNKNGLNSLMWAAFVGNHATLNTLLSYKADTNLETQHGSTAISFAAESGYHRILKQLLLTADCVNHIDRDGDTAMHCAAYNGHRECCKILIRNGATIINKNKQNKTALDYAIQRGHTKLVQYLQPLMPHNHKNDDIHVDVD
eukprot:191719_1